MFKAVDVETDEMAAWVRWAYPHALTVEEKAMRAEEKARKDAKDDFPEGANEEAFQQFFGAIDEMRKKHVVDSEYYGQSLF